MKLTIGIPVYDDFAGLWALTKEICNHHTGILSVAEFVIVDQNPGSRDGKATRKYVTKRMREWWCRHVKYVPVPQPVGVAPARNRIFQEAAGDFILCIDSHVSIHNLPKLRYWLEDNPNTQDLLTGPVVMDDSHSVFTHHKAQWTTHGLGVWDYDERAEQVLAPSFEIEMTGLGVFCCHKDAWPGFHSDLRGYGCVEPVLCEKFRRQGNKVLCLPFLRWDHRWSDEYLGPAYTISEYDRLRNYLIAFLEIRWDIQPVLDHFTPRLSEGDIWRIADELHLALERKERKGQSAKWFSN